MTATVLVSGASGFIALHTIALLLSKGYTVIGTVRSQSKADHLIKKFNNDKLSFEIVEEIAVEGAFDNAVKAHPDIKYVLHMASPFLYSLTDFENGYLHPAVNGTVSMLSAIYKYGSQVEKITVTSSFASIVNLDKMTDQSFIHTEETWNPIQWSAVDNPMVAYLTSKKLAEEAAWKFTKENDVKFSLSTICPPYVLGPQYFLEDAAKAELNTSCQLIKSLLDTKPGQEGVLDGPFFPAVDVRDVANFHVLSLEKNVAGQRLFPVDKTPLSTPLAAIIIQDNFPEYKGKIIDATQEDVKKSLSNAPAFDNSKSVELLGGYEFIPFEKQVVDTVKQILEATKSA
ncbi:CYFA0S02e00188g1_1 [Cyberlindnera fabianii]|uniref:CYFA0S02e00188g1_1 n=1 Tax=Cyberlindnera fabianii TaxID=36022 RepID=A0A061AL78_CYBFA|nr:putative NADPH-dependent methylglyoxal reductase GRP2 [Cyberlindnera fabianii]CDR38314.1 CYFA0S02e00188g1_1 [Cyberlindnera fabianii]